METGHPVVVYQQVTPTNSSSIVALVLGLISFISSFFFLGIVGIIFGPSPARRSNLAANEVTEWPSPDCG